jgi:hypothetical protein
MPCPLFRNQVEMVEDNLADLAPQARREIVGPSLFDLVNLSIQPEFALAFSLARMDVQGLVAFVRVEEEPPALHQQNRGHINVRLDSTARPPDCNISRIRQRPRKSGIRT